MTGFRLKILSFYGWFRFSRFLGDTATYSDAGSHKNRRLFSNFSVTCRILGAKMMPTSQIHSFPFPLPSRITPPDWPWLLFVCRFNKLQSAGEGYSWFTIPHHFKGRFLPSHHNSLSYRLLIYDREGQGCFSPTHPLYIIPRHTVHLEYYH